MWPPIWQCRLCNSATAQSPSGQKPAAPTALDMIYTPLHIASPIPQIQQYNRMYARCLYYPFPPQTTCRIMTQRKYCTLCSHLFSDVGDAIAELLNLPQVKRQRRRLRAPRHRHSRRRCRRLRRRRRRAADAIRRRCAHGGDEVVRLCERQRRLRGLHLRAVANGMVCECVRA
jgi:hypothetical protein